jgi:hypothetical protein
VGTVKVNGYTIEPGADLTGANLAGADLGGADLGGANLKVAEANLYTHWPEGFDPVAAGVTFK